jgi:hypothetical protein
MSMRVYERITSAFEPPPWKLNTTGNGRCSLACGGTCTR